MDPNDLENLFWWVVFGAGLGFVYAWRRTAAGQTNARQTIESTGGAGSAEKRKALAYLTGLKLGAGTVFAAIGAFAGALIWGAATLAAQFLRH